MNTRTLANPDLHFKTYNRAQRYIATIFAVEGQGGSNETFKACCALYGFGIEHADARRLIREWNRANATPQWSDRDLDRILDRVYAGGATEPFGGRVGMASGKAPRVERRFLPADEVQQVWASATDPAEDEGVANYLRSRGLQEAPASLCRALPLIGPALPEWCSRWPAGGYRLLIPLYDVRGHMRSLIGRCIYKVRSEGQPKAILPRGYSGAGLFMASSRAQQMLEGTYRPGTLHIVEGGPDFLGTWIDHKNDAVIGIRAGSWSRELAKKIDAEHTVIRTHHDQAGDKYAAQIGRSLVNLGKEVRRA